MNAVIAKVKKSKEDFESRHDGATFQSGIIGVIINNPDNLGITNFPGNNQDHKFVFNFISLTL